MTVPCGASAAPVAVPAASVLSAPAAAASVPCTADCA